jgi:hypothetical protein
MCELFCLERIVSNTVTFFVDRLSQSGRHADQRVVMGDDGRGCGAKPGGDRAGRPPSHERMTNSTDMHALILSRTSEEVA